MLAALGQGTLASTMTGLINQRLTGTLQTLRNQWEAKSLSMQFAMMGSVVLLVGMLLIGIWVAEKIETIVSLNMAVDSALYMDSFVAPHTQELQFKDTLSPDQEKRLDSLLHNTSIGNRIASFKIWKPDGLIAYSSEKSITGKKFPVTDNLKLAWKGSIASEFDMLEDEEDAAERAAGVPYLEIYSPIREKLTGNIIAVAEFYVKAELFQHVLFHAKLQSWMLVGFVTIVMLGLLFVIVHRGSRTIDYQKMVLESRVVELSDLRNRLKSASRKSTELNENFLRQVGSDLHDGPAQLLGLVLLRLDTLVTSFPEEIEKSNGDEKEFKIVQDALNDALDEIRNISAGLVLPELDKMSLAEVVIKATSTHELMTDGKIERHLGTLPSTVNRSTSICFYRFIQEGLNNAYRHATGAQCRVTAYRNGDMIEVKVSDSGAGFDPLSIVRKSSSTGLGLAGLRERIESLGGILEIQSSSNQGTVLTAKFAIADLEIEDG